MNIKLTITLKYVKNKHMQICVFYGSTKLYIQKKQRVTLSTQFYSRVLKLITTNKKDRSIRTVFCFYDE